VSVRVSGDRKWSWSGFDRIVFMLELSVNGEPRRLDIDPDMPLLWVLRDRLGLRGTKYGCGVGVCGICTVLMDGRPQRSCVVPAAEAADQEIMTIEGLAGQGHRVLSAWIGNQVPQCGYCQPGQILSAVALLDRHPDPTDDQIDQAMAGVLCRCGTYQRIRQAVHSAVRLSPHTGEPVPIRSFPADPGIALDEWIRIASDGTVTVTINHAEMGQGVASALATLVAEELEVDLAQVHMDFAPADRRYRNPMFGEQTTGGSTSVRGEWQRLSTAGARARERLLRAAAKQWRVRQKDCLAEHGSVVHRPSGRRLGYGELAGKAAKLTVPRRITLKAPGACRLLERPLPRLDIPNMCAGRTVYGLDVTLPDMRVAALARPPVPGGSLRDFDSRSAREVPGVEQIVPIGRGVAVVARDAWSALRGRDALRVDWDAGPNAGLNTASLEAQLAIGLDRAGEPFQRRGDVARVLERAAHVVEAGYGTALLAHAALEPMNCTARVDEQGCEVWVGTQSPELAQRRAMEVSGLPRARVKVHSQFMGGSFGRRLEPDVVEEAVAIAKEVRLPVQVIWSRDDDLQHDFYRPAYRSRMRAVLDAAGLPLAWFHRAAGAAVAGEGWAELPYAIPHIRVEFAQVDSPLPTGAWRSVGAGQDAFAVESFIDELALAAGRDPFEYRRDLLTEAPRHRQVLELAADRAGWSNAPPSDRHRGIAVYRSFGSYMAEVAEVSVSAGAIKVHRVVCAIDCGRIVNPDTIRAQIEGGVAFGLSAALKEQVLLSGGVVRQRTFEDYPILTLAEMPQVEVLIVDSDADPGGVGEPGVAPVAPAVANAVAAATGVRLRVLPLRFDHDANSRDSR
jgi:isoquinoline 1-oxidoreductase beta subunit